MKWYQKELDELNRQVKVLERKIEHKGKDIWDIVGGLSPLISGVLVASIGFYATNIYNSREKERDNFRKDSEIAAIQVQTVAEFIPHLSSGDQNIREAALIGISALGNDELATDLAALFGGSGSRAALARIASASSPAATGRVTDTLGGLYSGLETSVVRIEEPNGPMGTGFFVNDSGLIVTAAHVVKFLAESDINITVRTSNGKTVPATVRLIDEVEDLAFLKVELGYPSLPIELESEDIAIGSVVVVLGESVDGGLSVKVGAVNGRDVKFHTSEGLIGIGVQSLIGFSGAPAVNSNGKAIGLVHAGDLEGERTFLIPSSAIKSVLDSIL